MRSFLIVFGTAVVVAAAFGIYWTMQPRTRGGTATTTPVIPMQVVSGPSQGGIGPGHRPWENTWEKGVLKSQFTAAEFRPQADGSIQIDRPVMIFFMKHGRYVLVTGDTGVLDPPPGGVAKSGPGTGPMASPMSSSRNGRLHHVQIRDYPSIASTRPTMTIWTDNVRYDSDLLQLFTDAYVDPAGKRVAADQVPVTERGDDYDFDGKGLTVQWNGVTHRMQLLKIAHGDRLVMKNTAKMGMPADGGTGGTAAADAQPVPERPMLASTDRKSVALVELASPAPAVPATTVPAAVPIYHEAVFEKNVRIFQADHQSAAADTMRVDFLENGPGGGERDTKTPVAGSKNPTETPAAVGDDQPYVPPDADSAPAGAQEVATMPTTETRPTTEPAADPNAPVMPPVDAPGSPATRPAKTAKGPVTIRWTGELRVSELGEPPMMPLEPGQTVVRLIGAPALLTPVGETVTAARATYRTGDGALLAEPSAAVPEVVLVQDKGITLHTRRVEYDPVTSIATLTGISRLDAPQKKGPPMVVTWDDRGLLHTYGTKATVDGISQVDLAGHVSVEHPRFEMKSRTLRLDLDPAAEKKSPDDHPQSLPRRMLATGDVKARFHGEGDKTQGIDADKLDVGLEQDPAGKSFPKVVTADGHVVASQPDQTLSAKHLAAELAEKTDKPAEKPALPGDDDPAAAVDLVSMLSTGDVHAVTKAGATADSQFLKVTTVDGIRQVELWGGTGAVVCDGKGKTLTGSVLHLSPDKNSASVDGPGTIHSVASSGATPAKGQTSTATTRPADVSWTDSMSMDENKNAVEVVGNVEVRITDADGGISIFTGDRAHLDLEDAPKKPDELKPAKGDADQPLTAGKQVKRLTMIGHVVGDSKLESGGALARWGHVVGDKLIYTPADGRAEIPGPGRLLVENHKVEGVKEEKSTNNRGSMAVEWKDSLVYDDSQNQIDIKGTVRAGFLPDSQSKQSAEPMHLESDRLLITMKKTPAPATTATSRPAGDEQSHMQIDKAQAIGAVHFLARGGDVYCHTADFDPTGQRMTARGSDAEPGRASQLPGKTGGTVDGTFQELTFDTTNEEVVSVKGMGGVMRK